MGSNHSARRKTGHQLAPGISGSPTLRCSASISNGTSVPKRSKVKRSSSEKYVTASNSVVPVKGWAVAENERVTSSVCDISPEYIESEPAVVRNQHPYRPNGSTGWKMIDEDSLVLSTNNALCQTMLGSAVDNTVNTAKQQLPERQMLSALVVGTEERGHACLNSSGDADILITRNTDKFLSKTVSNKSQDGVKKHSDSCCALQSISYNLGSEVKNEVDVSANKMCSCRLSYRHISEQDTNRDSEFKELAMFKESSVNSAASHDSGRASSVEATATNCILPAVNGIDDLCLSLGSLGSDELMLDTEVVNFSSHGCDSNRSSFDAGRVSHRRRSSARSGQHEQRPNSLGFCQNRRSCGYSKWQNTDEIEFGMHKTSANELCGINGECNPIQELASLVKLHQNHLSDYRECPGQFSQLGYEGDQDAVSPLASTLMRFPRQNSVDTTPYTLDGLTYRRVMQDVTQFKTSLLKLKRLLQEDELRSSSVLKMGSDFGSCASPLNSSFMNGYYGTDGSTPTTPVSHMDFSTLSMEDARSYPALADILKENGELKVQLLRLQHVSEQQKATILLLQQQMTKYELGQDMAPGSESAAS